MIATFLILSWRRGSLDPQTLALARERCAAATGLAASHVHEDWMILFDEGKPWAALEGGGVAIGHFFPRDTAPGLPRAWKHVRASAPISARHLMEHSWGAFVACVEATTDEPSLVVRDPSGMMPCYRACTGNFNVFASDARMLVDCGFVEGAPDPQALVQHLLYPEMRLASTCIAGICEVLPGEAAELHQPSRHHPVWSAWDHVDDPEGRDPATTSGMLRHCIDHTVARLSKSYDRVLLDISGGLDSSIVAAALVAGGKRLTCLTMYTSDPGGDERDYARSVAQHVGARLEEIRFEPDDISLWEATAPHLPRPLGKMFKQALRGAHERIMLSHDIDAIFDGNGGDNVFCYLHSETPVVDRIRDQGILSSWPMTMVDMATITHCDLPRLLRRTAARLPRARRRYAWDADTRFLSADCLETADLTAAHPVLADTKGQLYGKSVHISLLLRMQNHVDPYPAETGLANIHPLLAQPVVETCLSIPTWQWCAGGINRSVARSAYRERLPAHIVRRVSKAGPDSFIFKVYDDQRDDIGVFLRDGVLAGYGIVDLAAIDAELTRSVPREQGHLRLLALCEAEAWARSWCPGARC